MTAKVRFGFSLSLLLILIIAGAALFADEIVIAKRALLLPGAGSGDSGRRDVRVVDLSASGGKAILWREEDPNDALIELYALSLNGNEISTIRRVSYEIRLRYSHFDPLTGPPEVENGVQASDNASERRSAFIVQFITQPLEEYRAAIKEMGGEVFIYLPDHSHIVQMDQKTRSRVELLPFVRWVGRYHPAYKIDPELLSQLGREQLGTRRYNIMVLRRGGEMHHTVADRIRSVGGDVHTVLPDGFRLEATLDPGQLIDIANDENVLFIDQWSAAESDMDIVRTTSGATQLETIEGFRGEGVRAEVADNGLRQTHTDFQSGSPPLIHNSSNTNEPNNHGTSTYGILFGRGTVNSSARGMLPEAQGIFADYDFMTDRYSHTARLNQPPYNAVFQSNSWGNGLTQNYNTIAAEFDDILFRNDILVLNSQSNTGTRSSRPQAWAKNAVSVGGIRHYGTAGFNDDRWAGAASIGPASDGRIKPDLAHFNDAIHTTANAGNSNYVVDFGGTSAATPITAGHFGLFYQMWHSGVFDNATGATVFESRPHMMTAKAMMINTAIQWDMTISGTDVRRVNQGFGRVSITNLYGLREKMLIVDEQDVLTALQSKTYYVTVPPDSPDPLKITMAFADPMGNPASTVARINDLNLTVTSPDGTVYRGNNGLGVGQGMWSTPDGTANNVDTVESVFIEVPIAGTWRIDVFAAEINQDARLETPGLIDADFALVASGIARVAPTAASVSVGGRVLTANGRAIAGSRISISGISGAVRTVNTNALGYYMFEGLRAGESYTIEVASKRFTFDPSSIVLRVDNDLAGVDFVAIE